MNPVIALTLLSFALLAGCSTPGAGAPEQDDEGRYVIHMSSGNKFSPADATVPVDSTVVWEHDGGAPHDVHAADGSFGSGEIGGIQSGEEWEHDFDETGSWDYECHVHAGMTGTITVE